MKRHNILTFLKALFSSQLASLVDISVTFLLANVFGLYYVYSTAIGSVSGGVFNCVVNYEWTFRYSECSKLSVAIKYIIVWLGSIFFNTGGTYLLTELMNRAPFVKNMADFAFDNMFMLPKIIVAVLVGIFWNYYLQKYFVFRRCFFDRLITK